MVIGNGLIAQTMRKYDTNDDVIIFASGVSNSNETRQEEFEREKELLSKLTERRQQFIYFSTCSIFDKSKSQSMYVLHKLEMEQYILNQFENCMIFRLPTVIADTPNPHTLFNFLLNNIKAGNTIPVYSKACRYLLDIEDVSYFLPFIIKDGAYNRQTINIAFDDPIAVTEMIKVYELVLNIKANIELIDRGDCFSIDKTVFINIIQNINYKVNPNYNINCIKKYCIKALEKETR